MSENGVLVPCDMLSFSAQDGLDNHAVSDIDTLRGWKDQLPNEKIEKAKRREIKNGNMDMRR
jgi:hypothetical protein